jgi:hypothetical protein
MIRNSILAVCAAALLAACASQSSHKNSNPGGNETYQPVTKPEKIEFPRAHLDIYPDDIRSNFDQYAGQTVVWAGIIQDTDVDYDENSDRFVATTTFEHHYFNGVQNGDGKKAEVFVSPRGEGTFRTRWHLDRVGKASDEASVYKFIGEGKLALVYGVPEKVNADGTVILKYRYLRILDPGQFSTNMLDYGRFGRPLRVLDSGNVNQ